MGVGVGTRVGVGVRDGCRGGWDRQDGDMKDAVPPSDS